MYFWLCFFRSKKRERYKMGVYIHKSILELQDLNFNEKLVLAYFFANKENLKDDNVVIANRLHLTKTNVRQIIFKLKAKKYIEVMGVYSCRKIKILKDIKMKFEKATFNGFLLDDDILILDFCTSKKFILAEIRSLIYSKNGRCTVSNLYLSSLLNLSVCFVKKTITELEKSGILKRDLKNVKGKTERTIILNLNNPIATDEAPAEDEKEVKEEAPKQQYDDEVLAVFESFPKRPMMTVLKIEEQKKLCLPILQSKSKEELDFIKFVISFNSKNNESWKAGFMPYMYKFLCVDKEKYFNEAVKLEFDKFKNKPKVNANLQLLNLQLERDLFTFFSKIEENVWELSDVDILEEFKNRYILSYVKFNDDDFNKMALQMIKEYRPTALNL
jgi:DNA-binding Lrp family transcriptional regulator